MRDVEIISTLTRMRAEIDSLLVATKLGVDTQDDIKNVVLEYFNISNEQLVAHNLTINTHVYPRDFYFIYAYCLTDISLQRLALNVGLTSHATVLNGLKVIRNGLETRRKDITLHYEYLNMMLEARGYDLQPVKDYILTGTRVKKATNGRIS